MSEYRNRFPFEISGLGEQRGMTGMEAVYDERWKVEAPARRPCPCQENGLGVLLPDPQTQYFMNMYPEKMSRVQRKVEEECDKMDYEGSIMYDEYPDQVLLKRISRNIYEVLLDDDLLAEGEVIDTDGWEVESEEEELTETGLFFPNPGRPPMGPGPARPPMGPGNPGGPARPPMGPGNPGRPGRPPMGPGPVRPPMKPGCYQGRCRGKDSWMKEAVDVLLLEEMQRRRRNRQR